MNQVDRREGWQKSLDSIYPSNNQRKLSAYTQLATNYLQQLTTYSASPVLMIWNPSLGDLQWALTSCRITQLKKQGREADALFLQAKARAGHAALAWKNKDGQVRYASFWPDLRGYRLSDGTRRGRWKTFLEEIKSSNLPDSLFINLTRSNFATFLGKPIESWDIERLDKLFTKKQNQKLIFYLKARDGAYSCSTMVLEMLQATVKKTSLLATFKESWSVTKKSWQAGGLWNKMRSAVVLSIKTYFLFAQRVEDLSEMGSEYLSRKFGVTPNFISSIFHVWSDDLFLKKIAFDTSVHYRIPGRENSSMIWT